MWIKQTSSLSKVQYASCIRIKADREVNTLKTGRGITLPHSTKTEARVGTDPVEVVCPTVIIDTKDSNCADRPLGTEKEADLHCPI